jgi:hypothetical protein
MRSATDCPAQLGGNHNCQDDASFRWSPDAALRGYRQARASSANEPRVFRHATMLRTPPSNYSLIRELAGVSARGIGAALNERELATPAGGLWHAATVIWVQQRLEVEGAGRDPSGQYARLPRCKEP